MVIDPLELLGKRIDLQIHILQCLGVKWIKEVPQRGIQIGYCAKISYKMLSVWIYDGLKNSITKFSCYVNFAKYNNFSFLQQREKVLKRS